MPRVAEGAETGGLLTESLISEDALLRGTADTEV